MNKFSREILYKHSAMPLVKVKQFSGIYEILGKKITVNGGGRIF